MCSDGKFSVLSRICHEKWLTQQEYLEIKLGTSEGNSVAPCDLGGVHLLAPVLGLLKVSTLSCVVRLQPLGQRVRTQSCPLETEGSLPSVPAVVGRPFPAAPGWFPAGSAP